MTARLNSHFLKLRSGYLFPEINRRVAAFTSKHPDKEIFRLGIGDVSMPLSPAIVEAFQAGVKEMGEAASFRGYGPEQGYAFLREAICEHEYRSRGIDISLDEIFISDGSKCDTGNIVEIFDKNCKVAISDPVYPVYVDTNVMSGRTGEADADGRYRGIAYMPCVEENGFLPIFPEEPVDIIYLCFPNNPTGAVAKKADLENWIRFATEQKAIILFDAAYEAFITDPDVPHSLFEIAGAKGVGIEFRSFSKKAGFTGVRCAYTVIPKELQLENASGKAYSLRDLWLRRQTTKFNGVAYPVQKAAAAVYSEKGKKETASLVRYYMENARILSESLREKGFSVHGGTNAPYIWVKTQGAMDSWQFFDKLLREIQVVGTPGEGFGPSGKGFFRFSAFAKREKVVEAMNRLKQI